MAARTAFLYSSSTGGRDSGIGAEVTGSGSLQTFVLATVVHERHALGRAASVHASDEDRVVALDVRVDDDALDVRQRVVQDRQPELADPVRHAVELVEPRGREAPRDVLLLAAEEVHREAAALDDGRVALGLVRHAHENQRGIERDGRERARGQPRGPAVRVRRGDDGDAAGEVTENLTKVVWRDHDILVAGSRPPMQGGIIPCMVTPENVLTALRGVKDPQIG